MNTKSFLYIYIIIISLISLSCTCNFNFSDSITNVDAAKEVTEQFYSSIMELDYASTDTLFSELFWESVSEERVDRIHMAILEKLGPLEEISFSDYSFKVVRGTNPSTNYTLIYNTRYKDYDAVETFHLRKDSDEKIRITSYHVNSEGLLN